MNPKRAAFAGRPFLYTIGYPATFLLIIFCESRARRQAMTNIELQSKSLDELWALHEEITSILFTKLEAEKAKFQNRLDQLVGRVVRSAPQRRPYPEVHPKFRNPKPPHQTWSGRGKQPLWLRELLARGKSLENF